MGGAGFVFVVLYFLVTIGIVAIVLLSLWRSMKAQEEMARTLGRIERVLARESPPL